MQNVANISILAMFVMYLLTALFGYLTFFGKILFIPKSQKSPCSGAVDGKIFKWMTHLYPEAIVLWMRD